MNTSYLVLGLFLQVVFNISKCRGPVPVRVYISSIQLTVGQGVGSFDSVNTVKICGIALSNSTGGVLVLGGEIQQHLSLLVQVRSPPRPQSRLPEWCEVEVLGQGLKVLSSLFLAVLVVIWLRTLKTWWMLVSLMPSFCYCY